MLLRTIPRSAVTKLGWTTASYGIVQVIRLVTNVVLARLLAPQLFGLMVIVNTIRTGVALLSDIGINQNIVSHPDGESPDFLDTAWTLQVIRGTFLGALCFALSTVAARFFEEPQLATILPVAAMFFIFGGFDSTGRSLLVKRMGVRRMSMFEVGDATLTLVVHVTLALITPTVWALVLGSAIMAAAGLVYSFLFIPGMRHRFIIDRKSAHQLIHFGKWIFFSSLVWFAAMNFDRLYLSKQIPLALLGVFGIARTLADTVTQVAARGGSLLLFPMVAAMQSQGAEVRARLRQGRRILLLLAAGGLAAFMAVSDLIIDILYDQRYQEAGILLPILLVGVWFAVLGSVNENILLGLRKPATTAIANLVKFLTYAIGVPLAFAAFGLIGAVCLFSVGEMAKYAALWLIGRRQHVGFIRDDVVLTCLFILAAFLFRGALHAVGLVGSMADLFPWAAAVGRAL